MNIPDETAEQMRLTAASSRDALDRVFFNVLESANIPWRKVSLAAIKPIVVNAVRARRDSQSGCSHA